MVSSLVLRKVRRKWGREVCVVYSASAQYLSSSDNDTLGRVKVQTKRREVLTPCEIRDVWIVIADCVQKSWQAKLVDCTHLR